MTSFAQPWSLIMKACLKAVFLTSLVLGVVQSSAMAGLIFDNTTTFLGPISFTALQIGDEVQVSGSGP
jgi:hypothetical protein